MQIIRVFFSAAFILVASSLYGQKLFVSPEVSLSNDENVKAIYDVWSKYINSYTEPNSDSLRSSLWHNGKEDIMKYAMSNSIFYRDGEQFTFSIRKVEDNFYEINTIAQIKPIPNELSIIIKIYKVYASKVEGQFKLFNFIDATKNKLNHYSKDNIDFYFPKTMSLDKEEVDEACNFIQDFKNNYNIDANRILYIVANSIDECWGLLGVPYTVFRSEKKYAGLALYSRVLLSTKPNHIHELVHSIMLPLYPNAHTLLHEGIATYYGGAANQKYTYGIKKLKEYIVSNKIDFTNYDELRNEFEPDLYIQNSVGALIIENTLTKHGHKKVLQLFKYNTIKDIFEELGVPEKDINNWVYDLIKQYE